MVRSALGLYKTDRSMRYFMCSFTEFKSDTERQMESWMNWDNRGSTHGKWQEDHIIPVSFFNLSDEVEKYMCCRYQNLRPLSWEENKKKGKKIIYHKNLTSELC